MFEQHIVSATVHDNVSLVYISAEKRHTSLPPLYVDNITQEISSSGSVVSVSGYFGISLTVGLIFSGEVFGVSSTTKFFPILILA